MSLLWNLSPKQQFKIAKDNPIESIIGIVIGFAITVAIFALNYVAY